MMFVFEEEIRFKPEGGNYREKRLPIGRQSMLNSQDQRRHKVSLNFMT
jgi:hypothetical protein